MMDGQVEVSDEFVGALQSRIIQLRLNIKLDPQKQTDGYRFKNDDYAIDMVIGFVAVATTRPPGLPVQPNAVGLTFSPDEVNAGRYDLIILETLNLIAAVDFTWERRVDFH